MPCRLNTARSLASSDLRVVTAFWPAKASRYRSSNGIEILYSSMNAWESFSEVSSIALATTASVMPSPADICRIASR